MKEKKQYINLFIVGILLIVGNKLIGNYGIVINEINKLIGILLPFIFGILIAYVLSGIMIKIEKI